MAKNITILERARRFWTRQSPIMSCLITLWIASVLIVVLGILGILIFTLLAALGVFPP